MVLPIFAIIISISTYTYRTTLAEMKEENAAANQLAESNIIMMLKSISIESDQFVNNPSIGIAVQNLTSSAASVGYRDYLSMRNIDAGLRSIISNYEFITDFSYYFRDRLYSYGAPSGRKLLDEPTYLELQEIFARFRTGESYIYYFPEEQESTFYITHPIYTGKGMMMAKTDQKSVMEWIQGLFGKSRRILAFYSKDGQLLASSIADDSLFDDGRDIVLADPDNEWIEYRGQRYYRNVSYQPVYEFFTVTLTRFSDLRSEIWPQMVAYIGIILTGIVIALLLAVTTAIRETRRIAEMIDLFDRAERGEYPLRQIPKHFRDGYDVITDNILYMFLHDIEQKDEKSKLERSMLQLQINPHFIFNALQNLIFQIRSGASRDAISEKMEDFSDIMRVAVGDPDTRIPLRESVEFLKKYVSLQEMRFQKQVIVYYEIDEELLDTIWVSRLLLQPIVENSLVHGMVKLDRQGYIKVVIYRHLDKVYFRVIDNGIGMTKETLLTVRERMQQKIYDRHIALSNVNRRLILDYGETAGLKILSKYGYGTSISFSVDMDKMQENEKVNT